MVSFPQVSSLKPCIYLSSPSHGSTVMASRITRSSGNITYMQVVLPQWICYSRLTSRQIHKHTQEIRTQAHTVQSVLEVVKSRKFLINHTSIRHRCRAKRYHAIQRTYIQFFSCHLLLQTFLNVSNNTIFETTVTLWLHAHCQTSLYWTSPLNELHSTPAVSS